MKSLRKTIALLMLMVLAPTFGFAGLLCVCLHGDDQRIEVVHFGTHDHSSQRVGQSAPPFTDTDWDGDHRAAAETSPCQDVALISNVLRATSPNSDSDGAPEAKYSPILSQAAQVPRVFCTSKEKRAELRDVHDAPHAQTIANLATVILII